MCKFFQGMIQLQPCHENASPLPSEPVPEKAWKAAAFVQELRMPFHRRPFQTVGYIYIYIRISIKYVLFQYIYIYLHI